MKRNEIINLIKTLLGAYPNTKIDNPKGLVDSWEMMFGSEDAETVYKAARIHMKNCKWFPKPSEIKKYMGVAPYLFNATAMIESPDASDDEEIPKTGCDICPYANTDWVNSPKGCHRVNCVIP